MACLQHQARFKEMVREEVTNNKNEGSFQLIRGLEGEVLQIGMFQSTQSH